MKPIIIHPASGSIQNGKILDYHNQIEAWKHTGSIHCLFEAGNIEEFYNRNKERLERIYKKISALQQEHFVIENERIKHDENKMPVCMEGKTREEYDKAYQQLMQARII